jgi:peroxiredoxin
LIEPGDSINVLIDNHFQVYSGHGADLFKAQYDVAQIDTGLHLLKEDTSEYFDNNTEKWLQQKDSLLNTQLEVLSKYKAKIFPTDYDIIRADIIATNRSWIYRRIGFAGPFFSPGLALEKSISDMCQELEKRPAYVDPADRAALSPKYVSYLYDKLRTEIKYYRVTQNMDVRSDENYFLKICKTYTGILRDKLLAWWLTRITSFNDLQPEYIQQALSVMKTPTFIQIVEQLKETYGKGQPLTDFNFKNTKDQTIKLTDLNGKVLVIDLWFSGCHGCIEVAKGLPKVENAFKGNPNVAFVSISIDKDKSVWQKSIDKNPSGKHYIHYTTPATIYLYTAGTGQDNAFIKKYVPDGSYPQLLIIDKNNKIYSSTPPRPITPKGQEDLIAEIHKALVND